MGTAKGEDQEMKTFKEISQDLKTRYYKKADATNRHGSAFMKTQAASHFGKPGDAKKLQKRYHSISNKMATARPAGESTDVKELSTPTLKSYLKKAGPQKDKYYSQYQKLRRSQDKKHGEFSPDMGKTKEVGRKAVNRDDGEYRAQKTLAKRGK